MKIINFDINPVTGDVSYLCRRDTPTPDGMVNHRGVIQAGDIDALDAGVTYSDDAIEAENPTFKTAAFPEHIKTLVIGMWKNPQVKKVIDNREEDRKKFAALKLKEAKDEELKKKQQEQETKKAFEKAVAEAVKKQLES